MRIVISAGPTREAIDPVRFITNRSTGKMGYAIAEAARERGLQVTLVSGPVNLERPAGVDFIQIESAADMAQAMKQAAETADIIVMAAAVADYRPKQYSTSKVKKSDGDMCIELERTEDILLSLGKNKKPGQILVGFAAETDDPTQEHGGDCGVDREYKMIFTIRDQHDILAKAVKDHIDQILVEAQFYFHGISGVHLE